MGTLSVALSRQRYVTLMISRQYMTARRLWLKLKRLENIVRRVKHMSWQTVIFVSLCIMLQMQRKSDDKDNGTGGSNLQNSGKYIFVWFYPIILNIYQVQPNGTKKIRTKEIRVMNKQG